MKTIKYLILTALLALAACSHNDDGDLTAPGATLPPGAVYLTGSVAGTTATRANIDPDDGSGTFTPGDTWGLFTLDADDNVTASNIEYTCGGTVLYWDHLSHAPGDITFIAHYPRLPDATNPTRYTFNVAEAAAKGLSEADLLIARATGNPQTNSAANPVRLSFRHALHSLRIHLTAGTGVDPAGIEGATVTLLNMKSTADITLFQDEILSGTLPGDTPYPPATTKLNPATGTYDARFIVAPQEFPLGTEWIKITPADGNTYIYKLPEKAPGDFLGLDPGEETTLNLTLTGKHTVELTSSDIGPWTEQNTVDGEVDMADGVKHIKDLKGFIDALTSQRGTAGKPARYVLKADIEMDHKAKEYAGNNIIRVNGHKVIDGDGHTVTRSSKGNDIMLHSSADGPSSLVLTDVTLADESGSGTGWFSCLQGSHWTLGKGVKVTTGSVTGALINVPGPGATLTVDGASFACDYDNTTINWIHVYDGTLTLNDITFGADDKGYIKMYGYGNNARLSLRPGGLKKPVRLLLDGVTSADFAITPTEGSFRAEDAMMLTVHPSSVIDNNSALPNGYYYAFYLDPADGNIKLCQAAITLGELKAAIDAATGTADRPETIVLGADIEVGNADLEIGQLNDKTIIKHIHIDGRGHTLTYNGTRGTMSYIYANNSLTLTNVTIDGGGKDVILLFANSGTVTLGGGATVTNTGSGGNACVYLNGGTLRMKPGSAVTGAKDWGIYSNLSYIDNVFFEGGTLSGNRVDVRMPVSIVPLLTVGVWPKMNGAAREKLTIELYNWDTSYEYPVAEPAPPLTSLEPGDFGFVEVTDTDSHDVTAQAELYKAGDGSIRFRWKPTD